MVLDTRGDNEELALIHRASNGDHEAFRLLVLSYEAQLLAYLMHMLGDRDSAYDVAQDTFVAVYYALPRWRPLSFNDAASITSPRIRKQLLAPWLYRIATVVSMTATPPQNVRQLAHTLVKQFHQEAAIWGAAHLYHDRFDGHDYQPNDSYMQAGLGG